MRRRRRLRQRLRAPKFHRPVHRARQEQIREVDRSRQRVEVQTHNRRGVSLVDVVLVQAGLRARAVVPIRLVDVALLSADPEGSRLIVREVEGSDGDLAGLIVAGVDEFEGFLNNRASESYC